MSVDTTIVKDKNLMTIRMPERFTFELHSEFWRACDKNSGFSEVNVDLSLTRYMDSSALGMLLQLKEKAAKKNSKIKVVNVNDNIMTILKIAKFDHLFTIQQIN